MNPRHASTGLREYDRARWSEWTPDCSRVFDAGGLASVYQTVPAHALCASLTTVPASDIAALLFWTKGQAVEAGFNAPRRRLRAAPWSYSLLAQGCASEWVSDARSADGVFHLHLSRDLLVAVAAEHNWPTALPIVEVADDPHLIWLGRRLFDSLNGENPSRLMWEAGAVMLAARLFETVSQRTPPITRGGLASWQERRVIDYLRVHLAHEVTLTELAALVDLSTFHFARAFKQSTGLPPHAYLRALRAERARELLETTTLSVVEIALETGYESSQALARAFRREVGMSPTEYRRERRR